MRVKHVWSPPKEYGPIAGMVAYRGRLIVATRLGGVFELTRDEVTGEWTINVLSLHHRTIVEVCDDA